MSVDEGTHATECNLETTLLVQLDDAAAAWTNGRSTKIVLSVDDEETLLLARQLATDARLPNALIKDRGLTEFGGVPTYTALAIGPARVSEIDRLTGREGTIATRLA